MWSQVLAVTVWLVICVGGQDAANTVENATHIGCYSVSPAQLDDFKIKYELPWRDCIAFCKHRTTKYAALKQDTEVIWDNYCYCFDELEDTLKLAANESLCLFCRNDDGEEHYCGGETTASIYKVRDSTTNHTLLVTTDEGDEIIVDNRSINLVYVGSEVVNVHFDFDDDLIFYGKEHNIIQRGEYSANSRKYLTEKLQDETPLGLFTVDWILNKVYSIYGVYDPNYYGYYPPHKKYQLVETDYKGQNIHVIISYIDLDKFSLLRVDCHNRLLFYLQNNELNSYNLATKGRHTYTNMRGYTPKMFAVDSVHNKIYLAASNHNEHLSILSLDYKNITKATRVVYRGRDTSNVLGMDVFDGELVWINRNGNSNYTIYKCTLSPICLQKSLTVIAERTQPIYSIKWYGPHVQTIGPCQKTNCSHICTVTDKRKAICNCPQDMTLGKDNVTCVVSDKKHYLVRSNITYLGCYATQHLRTQDPMEQLVTWESCINVCDNRRAEYVGIKAEERGSSFNYCYCGLQLENITKSVNDSCYPCYNNNTMFCGGNGTLSVYKLRDSMPLLMLLATSDSVKLLDADNNVTSDLVNSSLRIGAKVDYYSSGDDQFFWSLGNHVQTSYYSPFSNWYVGMELLPSVYVCADLTVDWIYRRFYCLNNGDLFSYGFSGVMKSKTHLGESSHLALDPYRRLVFYISHEKVNAKNLITDVVVKYDFVKHMVFTDEIALDLQRKRIFTFSMENRGAPFLVTFGYYNRKLEVVYRGQEVTHPFTIGYYNDLLIWGTRDESTYTLYKCKLAPLCKPSDLERIYQTTGAIYDAKIFDYRLQSFSIEDLCKTHNCSEGCNITDSDFYCSCPVGMELGENQKTCQVKTENTEVPKEIADSIHTTTIQNHTESRQRFLTSTLQYESDSSESIKSRTVAEPKASVAHPTAITAVNSTKTADSQHKGYEKVLLIFGLFSIVLVIFVVLYVKQKRSSLDVSDSYGQSSTLELAKI